MKRTIALIAIATLIVSMFCACGKPSTSSDPAGAIVPGVEVKFAEKNFTIVRPSGNTDCAALARDIFKAVKDNVGVTLTNADDGGEVNPAGEIIIGNTNRPQSKAALEILESKATGRATEYIICYIDGSIVINAMGADALANGVAKFVSDYCKTCIIDSGLCDFYTDNGDYKNITIGGVNIGDFTFVTKETNESYLVVEKVKALKAKLLTATGYDIPMVTDNNAAAANEIVVGSAARDGVKTFTNNEDYEIRSENGKLYVAGGRNYSTAYALEMLINELDQTGTIAAENKTGKYDKATAGEYKLTFQDEFETLNKDIWNIEVKKEEEDDKGSWYGMGVWRTDNPENVNVKNGKLYLTATYDQDNFYGSMVRSMDSVTFIKGYSEISAKIADGEGIWNCFWVYGLDWTDSILEFDVMECWSSADSYVSYIHESISINGSKPVDMVPACTHITMDKQYPLYSDYISEYVTTRKYDKNKTFATGFHTFGCEWTDSEVIFSRDGIETLRYNYEGTPNAWLYEEECYLMFSMLVGSNTSHLTEEQAKTAGIRNPVLGADYWNDDRASFIIEYAQIFQKDGQYINIK